LSRRRIFGPAAVAILLLAWVAWGWIMDLTSGPRTPQELAYSLFGRPPQGTVEPGVYVAELDESGRFTVRIRYALVHDQAVERCQERLLRFFAKVFRFRSVSSVAVVIDFPFLAEADQMELETGLRAVISRSAAEQVDWVETPPGNLPGLCDEWWQDPRLEPGWTEEEAGR